MKEEGKQVNENWVDANGEKNVFSLKIHVLKTYTRWAMGTAVYNLELLLNGVYLVKQQTRLFLLFNDCDR